MRTARNVLCFIVGLYLAGLLFVLAKTVEGYQGGDLMTEHYRSVLQTIFN